MACVRLCGRPMRVVPGKCQMIVDPYDRLHLSAGIGLARIRDRDGWGIRTSTLRGGGNCAARVRLHSAYWF
jgi:hypothetical protein